MLIEISIENFRSIRERQSFSMVAAPRLIRGKQNKFQPKVLGEKFPYLLKVAAIYGPNASGKSTLVQAFMTLTRLMQQKPSPEKKKLPVASFKFDLSLRDQPSRFEIHFIESEVRYSFELSLTAERIVAERLCKYRQGNEVELYSREYDGTSDGYNFGEELEGGEALHEAWRRLTGAQSLFLVQAVANSNEELNQLRKPYDWLSRLLVLPNGMKGWAKFSQHVVAEMPRHGEDVAKLLSDVDIPVSSIRSMVERQPATESEEEVGAENDRSESMSKGFDLSAPVHTTLTHRTAIGEAEFDFSEESEGTKNLFGFALPWFSFQGAANRLHRVLVVDELDSSLHPKLVEALVKKHVTANITCQLIFTTHDTHLMDSKLLRRDQLWLTERNVNGATELRSIYEFEGRESEDVEKRYYEGRYRSLPIIRID